MCKPTPTCDFVALDKSTSERLPLLVHESTEILSLTLCSSVFSVVNNFSSRGYS